jgi:hypothetical protein
MESAITQPSGWSWSSLSPPCHAKNCRQWCLSREGEFLICSSVLQMFFQLFTIFSIKKLLTLHAIGHNSAPWLKLELPLAFSPCLQQHPLWRQGEFLIRSSFYNCSSAAQDRFNQKGTQPPCHQPQCSSHNQGELQQQSVEAAKRRWAFDWFTFLQFIS